MNEKVLCGASYYEQKFYLNPEYEVLPELVKNELKILCVLFVQEVSGIIMLEFDDDGNLQIMVTAKDDDIYFDEIGSELKIRQIRQEKEELFRQLEEYYHAVSD
ncbi:MAG: hypothetical protein IKF90_11470 [Parasporobacterium sp.]|nr:hypothetical protein [Parasporobacterium sp.]